MTSCVFPTQKAYLKSEHVYLTNKSSLRTKGNEGAEYLIRLFFSWFSLYVTCILKCKVLSRSVLNNNKNEREVAVLQRFSNCTYKKYF